MAAEPALAETSIKYRRLPMRVPMPHQHELDALPDICKPILTLLKDRGDYRDYKRAARTFVDVTNGKTPNIFKDARLRYQNPDLTSANSSFAGIGEYNPERIPISTYQKMRLDPVMALGTVMIKQQILSQNYRIECSDEQIRAVAKESVRRIYRSTTASMIDGDVVYGFAAGEKVWETVRLKLVEQGESGGKKVVYNDNAVVPRKVKFVHPVSVRVIRDDKSEEVRKVVQVAGVSINNPVIPKPVPIEKMMWFAPNQEFGNVFGRARYRACYQMWYFSQIIVQYMLKYLERSGSPAIIGRAPLGSTITEGSESVDNLSYIMQAAAAVSSNAVVALPQQYDKNSKKELWDIRKLEDQQRGDMFIAVLEYLDQMKMRALGIPDKLGVSAGSSTNAASQTSLDMHLLNEESLIQYIEDAYNEQLVPQIIEYNFPPRRRVPCFLKIERLNFGKRTLMRDIFIRMIMLIAGGIRDGITPSWIPSLKKMAETLDIPGDDYDKIFLRAVGSSGTNDKRNGNNNNIPDNPDSKDTPAEKEGVIQDRNEKSVPRRQRTTKERTDRGR